MNRSVLVVDCAYAFAQRTASFLHQNGWRVFAAMSSGCAEEQWGKPGLVVLSIDLASSESVQRVVSDVVTGSGDNLWGVVIYVGCTQIAAVEDLSREGIRDQFENTVFGPIELVSRLIPVFRRHGGGRIVFINTLNGRFTFPYMSAYGSARRALESFYEATRRELRDTAIGVSCIVPYCLKQESDSAVRIVTRPGDGAVEDLSGTYRKLADLIEDVTDARGTAKVMAAASREVLRALVCKKPEPRVVIGLDSKVRDFLHGALPAKWLDLILAVKMKRIYRLR
jgi:NAD(P)-dependent dehydrogenase (short-subunit alcohol dehydrogenase family)